MCWNKLMNTPIGRQIWVSLAMYLVMVGNGMHIGMTTSILAAFQDPKSSIKLSQESSSWIGAIIGVASVAVLFITPILISRYGRRTSIFIQYVPIFIAGFLTCFTSDINILIFSRFLSGLSIGGNAVLASIIVGEYSSPEYRGIFLTLKSTSLYVGFTVAHILGHYLYWKIIVVISTLPYIVTISIMIKSPESPSWLVTRQAYDACAEAFYLLRGKTEASTKELDEMITAQKDKTYKRLSITEQVMMFLKKFKKGNFLKPMAVYSVVAIFLEFTGRHTYSAYAMQIIQEMDNDRGHTFYYTLCFDLLMTISAVSSTVLVKHIKRRTLMFSTGALSVVIILTLSAYYYLQGKGLVTKEWDLIPLILFAAYFIIINLGCTPISLNYLGEIFPLEHRASSVCFSGMIVCIFMVISMKAGTYLMDTDLKLFGIFLVFGVIMSVSLIVLYFTLPETKDKTLQEIEDSFDRNMQTYNSCRSTKALNAEHDLDKTDNQKPYSSMIP